MSRMTVVFSLVAIALFGLVTFGQGIGTTAQEGAPAAGQGFVGSWRLTDTTLDLPSLGAFTSDGVFFASNLPVEPVPPELDIQMLLLSGSHVVWEATGDDTAVFTFSYLYVNDQGQYESTLTASGTLELGADGQTLSGEYAYQVAQPDGTVVHTDRATVDGTRIGIIPMESIAPPAATPDA